MYRRDNDKGNISRLSEIKVVTTKYKNYKSLFYCNIYDQYRFFNDA